MSARKGHCTALDDLMEVKKKRERTDARSAGREGRGEKEKVG